MSPSTWAVVSYTAVHTDERTLKVDTSSTTPTRGRACTPPGPGKSSWWTPRKRTNGFRDSAAAARAQGIRSFLAAPLFTNEQSVGSFNLYGRDPAAFDSLDAEILDLLTTAVSRTIGDFARYKSASRVAETIQGALENRAPIEQAKGMLMALHGIDAGAAFDMLRQESQAKNIRLHVIASDLVQRLSQTDGAPTNGRNGSPA